MIGPSRRPLGVDGQRLDLHLIFTPSHEVLDGHGGRLRAWPTFHRNRDRSDNFFSLDDEHPSTGSLCHGQHSADHYRIRLAAGKDTEKVDNRLAIPLFYRHAHGSAHWGFDGQRPPTAHEHGACMSAARFHAEFKTPDISHRPGAVYFHLALYA